MVGFTEIGVDDRIYTREAIVLKVSGALAAPLACMYCKCKIPSTSFCSWYIM